MKLSFEDRNEVKFNALITDAYRMRESGIFDNSQIVAWQDFLSRLPLGKVTSWIWKLDPLKLRESIKAINFINGSGNLIEKLCIDWYWHPYFAPLRVTSRLIKEEK